MDLVEKILWIQGLTGVQCVSLNKPALTGPEMEVFAYIWGKQGCVLAQFLERANGVRLLSLDEKVIS
jgi:hypothetical protein